MSIKLGILASSLQQGGSYIPPLDVYPGAAGAYSVRKLRTAYTGPCMRVVRSSDGVQMDIGFLSNGLIDTTSLLTFIGLNSAIVFKWYDQSGNARDAIGGINDVTQNQKIVINGVLQTQLGKPAIKFFTNQYSGLRTQYNLTNPFTMIGVIVQDSGANLGTRIFSSDNSANLLTIARVNVTSVYTGGVVCDFPSKVLGQTYLVSFSRQSTISYVYQNGTIVPNSSTLSNDFGNFAMNSTIGASEGVESRILETIIYPSNQNSNISGLNTNINSFYSIY